MAATMARLAQRNLGPIREFAHLWERMNRLFEQGGGIGQDAWVPAVETEETEDAYVCVPSCPA